MEIKAQKGHQIKQSRKKTCEISTLKTIRQIPICILQDNSFEVTHARSEPLCCFRVGPRNILLFFGHKKLSVVRLCKKNTSGTLNREV